MAGNKRNNSSIGSFMAQDYTSNAKPMYTGRSTSSSLLIKPKTSGMKDVIQY